MGVKMRAILTTYVHLRKDRTFDLAYLSFQNLNFFIFKIDAVILPSKNFLEMKEETIHINHSVWYVLSDQYQFLLPYQLYYISYGRQRRPAYRICISISIIMPNLLKVSVENQAKSKYAKCKLFSFPQKNTHKKKP